MGPFLTLGACGSDINLFGLGSGTVHLCTCEAFKVLMCGLAPLLPLRQASACLPEEGQSSSQPDRAYSGLTVS